MINSLVIFKETEKIAELEPEHGKRFVLGGSSTCDCFIEGAENPSASLEFIGDSWWITDLSESGSLSLNGKMAEKEPLPERADVQISGIALTFMPAFLSGRTNHQLTEFKDGVYREVLERMNTSGLLNEHISDKELEKRAFTLVRKVTDDNPSSKDFSSGEIRQAQVEIIQDLLHLGPLEPLLENDEVTEIMVIDYRNIYMEKKGKIELSDRFFRNPEHLLTVIERIVSPIGRRIDESSPLVDARLPDGSRVNAVIPPIVPDGACLTIRKFGKNVFTVDRLIEYGSMIPHMAYFLERCVQGRKNIVVSGGTGSGKTSLLNAISMFIGHTERIITIEDSLELKLQQKHVVRMEARPPNAEGKGEVTIRRLVKNSLRMRPDRIVIGECRGGEALDMLQAMNTGHDGSLTTVHANSPKDALSRLETLVLMAGMELPLSAIRNQICSAVDLIVQTARLSDGTRKVVSITELAGIENGEPVLNEIFTFRRKGLDVKNNNRVLGEHIPVGRPTFMQEFLDCGIKLEDEWFQPGS